MSSLTLISTTALSITFLIAAVLSNDEFWHVFYNSFGVYFLVFFPMFIKLTDKLNTLVYYFKNPAKIKSCFRWLRHRKLYRNYEKLHHLFEYLSGNYSKKLNCIWFIGFWIALERDNNLQILKLYLCQEKTSQIINRSTTQKYFISGSHFQGTRDFFPWGWSIYITFSKQTRFSSINYCINSS